MFIINFYIRVHVDYTFQHNFHNKNVMLYDIYVNESINNIIVKT